MLKCGTFRQRNTVRKFTHNVIFDLCTGHNSNYQQTTQIRGLLIFILLKNKPLGLILNRLLHVLTKNLIYDIIFYKSELNPLKED